MRRRGEKETLEEERREGEKGRSFKRRRTTQ
jgi:hypothetical protein